MILTVVLYIVLSIYARYKDKKDATKVSKEDAVLQRISSVVFFIA